MPKINIDHNSSLPSADAYKKLKDFFENDADIKKLDSKMKATYDDATKKGQVKGSQFKADIAVEDAGSGSKIKVLVDLPFLLTPFKGKIEETLQNKLKKYLA